MTFNINQALLNFKSYSNESGGGQILKPSN